VHSVTDEYDLTRAWNTYQVKILLKRISNYVNIQTSVPMAEEIAVHRLERAIDIVK
jgi:hypothetical protein